MRIASGLTAARAMQEHVARHAGHPLVGQDQLDVVGLEDLDRFGTGGGSQHVIPAVKLVAQTFQYVHLVVHDQ